MASGQSQSEQWRRLQGVKTALSRGDLLVLLELIGRRGRGSEAVSISTNDLAAVLDLHPRNVERATRHLLERGYVRVVEQGGGRNRSNVYRITLPETPAQLPVKGAGKGGAGAGETPSRSAAKARRNPGAAATKTPATALPIAVQPTPRKVLSVRLLDSAMRPPTPFGRLVVDLPARLRKSSSR